MQEPTTQKSSEDSSSSIDATITPELFNAAFKKSLDAMCDDDLAAATTAVTRHIRKMIATPL